MSIPLTAIRSQLPQLEGKIYLDHARSCVIPTSVSYAQQKGLELELEYSFNSEARNVWLQAREGARRSVAELIGARSENVAFVSSTSAALSIVSLALRWNSGDNVIACGVDNPAAIVPWQNLREDGVEVRYLPFGKDDLVQLNTLHNLIDRKTRLIALSAVQYATGERLELSRVAELCRRRNVLLCVDGVQAAGAVQVNVQEMGANFLAFGAQKWLMGPRNIAVLYCDDVALDRVRSPIVTESNVRDIKQEEERPTAGIPQLHVHPGALKLEATPYNNFPGIFGLQQALDTIRVIGMPAIESGLRELTDYLIERAKHVNARVVSPRGPQQWSGIVSMQLQGSDALAVATALRDEHVYVSARKGRIRVSPHYYNTRDDIDCFASMLATIARA